MCILILAGDPTTVRFIAGAANGKNRTKWTSLAKTEHPVE